MDNNLVDKKLLITETDKYTRIWQVPEYTYWSGECEEVSRFLDFITKRPVKNILVLGCGQGFGLHELGKAGYQVFGVDLVDVLKFSEYKERLTIAPIWQLPYKSLQFDALLCCDVLEHIPPSKIMEALREMNRVSKFWYCTISCRPDRFGRRIGEDLHLTVHKPGWWMNKLIDITNLWGFSGNTDSIKLYGRHKEYSEHQILDKR